MSCKFRSAFVATVCVVTALSVMPADAAKKKKPTYRASGPATLSLDGRNTGRTRTCWSETFIYDGYGVPVGPYCH